MRRQNQRSHFNSRSAPPQRNLRQEARQTQATQQQHQRAIQRTTNFQQPAQPRLIQARYDDHPVYVYHQHFPLPLEPFLQPYMFDSDDVPGHDSDEDYEMEINTRRTSPSTLNSLPTFQLTKNDIESTSDNTCCICLGDYLISETVTKLP